MSETLLTTKLYIPPYPSNIVRRPHLLERLNEGLTLGRKLTLISAPAGSGKSTLVSEWIDRCERPVAWLSLDEGDNDPVRFLTYLITALHTFAPNFGKGILSAIQSPQFPSTESILTRVINEITLLPNNFILFLDDYHLIDSKQIDHTLSFLLDHLPSRMHLVIATREDPSLPLPRYRARGQMTEMRAADLRFSPGEIAEFFNRIMGLNLGDAEIASLEVRTEGWVAGLQLAALSMREHSNIAGFIQSFSGSHQFILDFLVEEVLERQPEKVRNFLLETAILHRLSSPLCNAVTGREDGKLMLESLVRENLFVIPLDNMRQWYRYHHLFAEVLQARLNETHPDRASLLHLRASEWFEQNGLRSDAIRHALMANEFEYAASLIELARPAMDISFKSSTWLGWVKALPEVLIRARPVLCVGYAWALLDAGELEASEARLQDAESWLDAPTNEMVVVDNEQFRSLPATISTARAYRSLGLGDVAGALKNARQALERTPEDDRVRYVQSVSLLGLAEYTSGNLQAAERSLVDFYSNLRKSGEISTLIGVTFLLADIRMAMGRLHDAENIYRISLRLAGCQGEQMFPGTADLYRGLAGLYIERGELEAARQYLSTSQKLGEQNATTDWLHRLYVSQARLKEVHGDLVGALTLLDEAERVYIRSPLPDVHPTPALKTRIWLKQGKLADALGWVREQALSVEDEFQFAREYDHVTLARVLIAVGKSNRQAEPLDKASRLLGSLLQVAEKSGHWSTVIEVLLLQALNLQVQGNPHMALLPLERALHLAMPEGFVRIFVDEGHEMRQLLEKLSHNRDNAIRNYTNKLLAAFSPPETASASSDFLKRSEMLEPLSERELEVLKMLRSEFNGPEIARQLLVSLNTLRTHTNNIFKKLGVNNRRAAVRRGQEIGLI